MRIVIIRCDLIDSDIGEISPELARKDGRVLFFENADGAHQFADTNEIDTYELDDLDEIKAEDDLEFEEA